MKIKLQEKYEILEVNPCPYCKNILHKQEAEKCFDWDNPCCDCIHIWGDKISKAIYGINFYHFESKKDKEEQTK